MADEDTPVCGAISRSRPLRWALAVTLSWGCAEAPTEAPPPDPCTTAVTISLGQTAQGVLDAGTDCFGEDGRLGDFYALTLAGPTLFTLTLSTEGYLPFAPTYREGNQISGWASDSDTELTREHLYPPGAYVVRASSLGQSAQAELTPQGPYTLTTASRSVPQEGCERETSVTYGSEAFGRIAAGDCEGTSDTDATAGRSDGYTAILEADRPMAITVTADFPFRVEYRPDGAPTEEWPANEPGAAVTFAATGPGFHDVYILGETAGDEGRYTISFQDAPPG